MNFGPLYVYVNQLPGRKWKKRTRINYFTISETTSGVPMRAEPNTRHQNYS